MDFAACSVVDGETSSPAHLLPSGAPGTAASSTDATTAAEGTAAEVAAAPGAAVEAASASACDGAAIASSSELREMLEQCALVYACAGEEPSNLSGNEGRRARPLLSRPVAQ